MRLKKIDLQYLYRNAPLLMVKDGINSLGVLAISLVAANFLTLEVFGTYKYILSLVGIASVFSLTGAHEALLRQSARDHGASMLFLCKKSLVWNTVTTLILGSMAGYYLMQGDTMLATGLLIPAVAFPVYKTALLYRSFLNGTQRFKEFAIYGSVSSIVTTLIIGAAMYWGNAPVLLVSAFYISNTVIALVIFALVYKRYIQHLEHTKDAQTLRFSSHLSLINIIGQISSHLDSLLAFQLLGPAALAVYSFAKTPVEQVKAQVKVLSDLVAPRFSTRTKEDIRSNILHKAGLLLFTGLLLSVGYSLAAPYLFSFLFPQYMEAVFYTQILSLTLISIPNIVFMQALIATHRARDLYIVRSVPPFLKIISLVILGYLFGLLGLVLSILIGRVSTLGLSAYFFLRK